MSRTSDALVIGGGLHGLSAALQLARRGVSVRLLERARIGRHSSGSSAAGVRTLGRGRAEMPLALEAMEMWHHMRDIVGDDCGFLPHGQLKVAETADELDQLRRDVDARVAEGFFNERLIGHNELHDLAPALAPHCVGAIYTPRDGAADPHRTLNAYLSSAIEAGVDVREGSGALALSRRGATWIVETNAGLFEAPMVVNAAGAWAGRIAALAGDSIPITTKASMMIVTERVAPFLRPTVAAAGRTLSFKQTDQGTILIGGGQQGSYDLDKETGEIDVRRLSKSATAARALFPAIGNLRIVRSWAGLEATTKDHMAIVGMSPSSTGLMHLFGFSGHGFQLVPAAGVAAAQLLIEGGSNVDVSGLSAQRLM